MSRVSVRRGHIRDSGQQKKEQGREGEQGSLRERSLKVQGRAGSMAVHAEARVGIQQSQLPHQAWELGFYSGDRGQPLQP